MLDRLAKLRDAERAAHDAYVAAVREARETHTLQEIATALGISRQRVHQLVGARVAHPDESGLRARLAELDARWDELVDRMSVMFETADPRADQARRNLANARISKAQRPGNGGYVSARRGARKIPTVKQDARRLAEAKILRLLDERGNETVFVKIRAELDEAAELRQRVHALQDARTPF